MFAVGSILDRVPGRKYVAQLSFAELSLRAPLPRAATLARWREELPEGYALSLRAPRSALAGKRGPLRLDAENESALAWVLEAASVLQVRTVVLPTSAELAPGARSRELLAAFAERLPRVPERHYVWSPSGVWETEDSTRLCEELGLVRAFDPLQMPRPSGEVVYAELRALGHRAGFSLGALEDALSVITNAATREAFIVVDAPRGFEIATRLAKLAAAQQGVEASVDEGARGPRRARTDQPGELEGDPYGDHDDEELDDELHEDDDEDEDDFDHDEGDVDDDSDALER